MGCWVCVNIIYITIKHKKNAVVVKDLVLVQILDVVLRPRLAWKEKRLIFRSFLFLSIVDKVHLIIVWIKYICGLQRFGLSLDFGRRSWTKVGVKREAADFSVFFVSVTSYNVNLIIVKINYIVAIRFGLRITI